MYRAIIHNADHASTPASISCSGRVSFFLITGEDAMRKLRLNLEELAVESFDTLRPDEKRGTVEARVETWDEPTCARMTCKETCLAQCSWVTVCAGGSCGQTECCTTWPPGPCGDTCYESCLASCAHTCWHTCQLTCAATCISCNGTCEFQTCPGCI